MARPIGKPSIGCAGVCAGSPEAPEVRNNRGEMIEQFVRFEGGQRHLQDGDVGLRVHDGERHVRPWSRPRSVRATVRWSGISASTDAARSGAPGARYCTWW